MSEDKEPFLSRWSRRKLELEKQGVAVKSATDASASSAKTASPSSAEAPPPLPSLDSLQGLASEYKEFLRPGVDENLRRAALKRLFGDPRFNAMDGLDVYVDDYSLPDPIPEAMMRTLEHARDLLADRIQPENREMPEMKREPLVPAAVADTPSSEPQIEVEKETLPPAAPTTSTSKTQT